MLNIAALVVTLTAIFSYLNLRLFKLPTTIGVMIIAVILSLIMVGLNKIGILAVEQKVEHLLYNIDFHQVLMEGMLSLLLFAGAMHVDLSQLAEKKWTIGVLATIGTLASTLLVGIIAWWIFDLLGIKIPLIYCLLFGSLISPTDPIAVLGILKSANVPASLEIKIAGESLFNDGMAVVVFTILLTMAIGDGEITITDISILFAEEVIGGAVFGFVIGYIAYRMIKSIDSYHVEVLVTLGLVLGGYALAREIHVSGPIAMVVAGLLIGNHGRTFGMSEKTRERLDTFWEIIDELLNSVLFVLIGFEIVVLTFTEQYLLASAIVIPLILIIRFLCVGIPIKIIRATGSQEFSPHSIKILTWAGVRGGISVALALSLPSGPERDVIVSITYVTVLFSIVVQGLSIGRVIKCLLSNESRKH